MSQISWGSGVYTDGLSRYKAKRLIASGRPFCGVSAFRESSASIAGIQHLQATTSPHHPFHTVGSSFLPVANVTSGWGIDGGLISGRGLRQPKIAFAAVIRKPSLCPHGPRSRSPILARISGGM